MTDPRTGAAPQKPPHHEHDDGRCTAPGPWMSFGLTAMLAAGLGVVGTVLFLLLQ